MRSFGVGATVGSVGVWMHAGGRESERLGGHLRVLSLLRSSHRQLLASASARPRRALVRGWHFVVYGRCGCSQDGSSTGVVSLTVGRTIWKMASSRSPMDLVVGAQYVW